MVPGYADPDVLTIRRDSPTACSEAISVLLAISAGKGREKWVLLTVDVQAAFLKGEFESCTVATENSPALPGVQPGSLLLIPKRSYGIE